MWNKRYQFCKCVFGFLHCRFNVNSLLSYILSIQCVKLALCYLYIDPCVSRHSVEMSLTMKEIFEAVVLTELFPHSVIDIYVQVLQLDGGKEYVG